MLSKFAVSAILAYQAAAWQQRGYGSVQARSPYGVRRPVSVNGVRDIRDPRDAQRGPAPYRGYGVAEKRSSPYERDLGYGRDVAYGGRIADGLGERDSFRGYGERNSIYGGERRGYVAPVRKAPTPYGGARVGYGVDRRVAYGGVAVRSDGRREMGEVRG